MSFVLRLKCLKEFPELMQTTETPVRVSPLLLLLCLRAYLAAMMAGVAIAW